MVPDSRPATYWQRVYKNRLCSAMAGLVKDACVCSLCCLPCCRYTWHAGFLLYKQLVQVGYKALSHLVSWSYTLSFQHKLVLCSSYNQVQFNKKKIRRKKNILKINSFFFIIARGKGSLTCSFLSPKHIMLWLLSYKRVCVQHMAFRTWCACDGDVRGTCGGMGNKRVSKTFQKHLPHFKQFPIKWCQPRHLIQVPDHFMLN